MEMGCKCMAFPRSLVPRDEKDHESNDDVESHRMAHLLITASIHSILIRHIFVVPAFEVFDLLSSWESRQTKASRRDREPIRRA
jgi:hypothetical protein